jgi:hypothetical protein
MWTPEVVKANPAIYDPSGVLQKLKGMAMCALLLERPDQPINHPILLCALGRDEHLLYSIALLQGRVAAACEYHTIVCPKQEGLFFPPETPVAGD